MEAKSSTQLSHLPDLQQHFHPLQLLLASVHGGFDLLLSCSTSRTCNVFVVETAPLKEGENHQQNSHEGLRQREAEERKEEDELKALEVIQGRQGKTLPVISKKFKRGSTFNLGLEQKAYEYNNKAIESLICK